jgi:nitrogenase-stabilizing/protective protein
MTVLEQLSKLSSAEEFFQFLEVPYEPAILNVARLHILKRMAEYLRNCPPETDDDKLRAICRGDLERAYLDFVSSSPLNERVFKVLKDAVRPKTQPLVSLLVPGQSQNG